MPPKKTEAQIKRQREKDKKRRQKEDAQIQEQHDAHANSGAANRKEDEEAKINKHLALISRHCVTVAGDGDCLYTAVLEQMRRFGPRVVVESPAELRKLVSAHIQQHADEYSHFIVDLDDANAGSKLEKYCKEIEAKAWGTQIELRAIAEVLGKRIALVSDNGVDFFGGGELPVRPDDWCVVFYQHAFILGGHFNATSLKAASDEKEGL